MNLLAATGMILNAALSDRRRAPFMHVLPCCVMMSSGFLITGLTKRRNPPR